MLIGINWKLLPSQWNCNNLPILCNPGPDPTPAGVPLLQWYTLSEEWGFRRKSDTEEEGKGSSFVSCFHNTYDSGSPEDVGVIWKYLKITLLSKPLLTRDRYNQEKLLNKAWELHLQ